MQANASKTEKNGLQAKLSAIEAQLAQQNEAVEARESELAESQAQVVALQDTVENGKAREQVLFQDLDRKRVSLENQIVVLEDELSLAKAQLDAARTGASASMSDRDEQYNQIWTAKQQVADKETEIARLSVALEESRDLHQRSQSRVCLLYTSPSPRD